MALNTLQTSFAAGELAPALYARVDLEKYKSGMAVATNWFIDYRGGASTRPGSQFVGQCVLVPGRPRLIPFVVSTIAAYALEFGDRYIRFVADGAFVPDPTFGTPLTITSPYTWAELPLVKYSQSANVLTLTHPDHPVYDLRRVSASVFTLIERLPGPSIDPPITVNASQRNGTATTALYGYVVTAINSSNEESIASYPQFIAGDILNQNTGIENVVSYSNVADALYYKVYKSGPVASGNGNIATPPSSVYGLIGQSETTSFVDNNIAPDYASTPPTFQDPFTPGQIANVVVVVGGGGYTSYTIPLIFTGDGTGAKGYGIIDISTGAVVGVVITDPGHHYTTCVVADATGSAAYSVTLGQQSGTFPFASGYFQQRQVFGGTNNFPESMVFSQPGAYSNFDVSPISRATDAITASAASRQVNAILSFTPMPTGLIVLTTGGGFLVSGGSQEAPLTPSTISIVPQASSGCNNLPPLVINYDVLYAQNRGAVVRDLAFNFYVQSYTGTDRSVLASHLFTNYTLEEWTYAEEPFRLVQAVRNDGTLLNFTYVPEQEIFAWTPAKTQGYYRSICSIPEGQVNAVYTIVERLVGNAVVYYIERINSRQWSIIEDAWCLDCALALPGTFPSAALNIQDDGGTGLMGEYVLINCAPAVFTSGDVGKTFWALEGRATITAYNSTSQLRAQIIKPFTRRPEQPTIYPFLSTGEWELNANVTTISGLWHLEGELVSALADGVPVAPQRVTLGEITVPSSSKVIAGLSYTCPLQTLRWDGGEPTAQGKRKIIPSVTAIVNQTLGLKVGPRLNKLTPMKELIGTYPPYLLSTEALTNMASNWTKDGQFWFLQDLPLPATILGIIPEVKVGDTGR